MSAPVDVVCGGTGGQLNTHRDTLAADGVGYAWAEFESYFDANLAAEFWEAAIGCSCS